MNAAPNLIEYAKEHLIEQIMALAKLPHSGRRYLRTLALEQLRELYAGLMADAVAEFEPYRVINANLISVCANCYPGDSITKLFPDLAGVDISHGICPGHVRREILEWNLRKEAKKLEAVPA